MYNDEEYLRECLNSVFKQTLNDIEVVCVNDGSTDGTLKILEEYAAIYSNMKIINQDNSGVGISRNRGIKFAQGDYIAFMDGDDYYPTDDVLKCLYESAMKANAPVCGGSLYKNRNGVIIRHFYGIEKKFGFEYQGNVNFAECGCAFGFTRFIYKREILLENEIEFPDYGFYEDPLFFTRVMARVEGFFCINKVVYIYRVSIHERNYSQNSVLEMLKSMTEMFKISKEKEWESLKESIISLIFENYYFYICQYSGNGNKAFIETLDRFIQEINSQGDIETFKKLSLDSMKNYVVECMKTIQDFQEKIQKFSTVIIYGAGEGGKIVQRYLKNHLNKEICSFAVSSMEENNSQVNGIPVATIESLVKFKEKGLFIVAVSPKYRVEIKRKLISNGIKNIFCVDFRPLDFILQNDTSMSEDY